uniref:SJCHGC07960 protein n=1 Tax=Schistosoma japonicum TaxID=6182 RepID=Q5D8F6_SCHJA|nr:SJCHGC07960 protein [Schistosoma japonicum]
MVVTDPCPSDFVVERFIGRGCYSLVYKVRKTNGPDTGSKYALKRFLLKNDSAIKCVLRERRILERLAVCDFQSPFLPMLCYSMWKNYSSAFVLREGSGCDLYDLLCHVGCLSEANTRFYVAEIICGLEHLHSLNIVHLDVKPENILFYPDGHVFVSDLDRSYDISQNTKPTLDDFTGTPLFMAPEVARGEVIDMRSDIWSWVFL